LQPTTVLIVDEAQSSYRDKQFWLELKDINPETSSRVITLASYGSSGHNIYDPMIPFHISPQQNIGLVPVDHDESGFFSRKPSLMKSYQYFFEIISSTSLADMNWRL
jgi:hypothetical protein